MYENHDIKIALNQSSLRHTSKTCLLGMLYYPGVVQNRTESVRETDSNETVSDTDIICEHVTGNGRRASRVGLLTIPGHRPTGSWTI